MTRRAPQIHRQTTNLAIVKSITEAHDGSQRTAEVSVWIDQDLCTGDGLCTDHCPEVFVLLEDGISYVIDPDIGVRNDPGGAEGLARVRHRDVDGVIVAAEDCPGECIFIEVHEPAEDCAPN